MSTPNYGFPFPVQSDIPDTAGDLQALAEAVDAKIAELHGANWFTKSAAGSVSSGGSTISGNTSYAIDYTAAGFTGPPIILLSNYDAQMCVKAVHNNPAPTATGATILARPEEGVGSTFVRIRWVAFGN